jgi:hypothetical protein
MKRLSILAVFAVAVLLLATSCANTGHFKPPFQCPAEWTPFDCARMRLAFDTMDVLDHDELGDQRTLWYRDTNPAWADVVSTWNSVALGEPKSVNREMDDYEKIVNRSDARPLDKRMLIAASRRLRKMALAELAAGQRRAR